MPATGPKRLNWEWEELVLACDLVIRNNGRYIDHQNQRAVELSQVLQQMGLHPREARRPDFRNPNSVALKARNLIQHLPGYSGSASRGSKKDGEVVKAFLANPEGMHELAQSIRAAVASGNPLPSRPAKQLLMGDDLTSHRLEEILGKLNVNHPNQIPALYQPITLLWAFSRARRGESRLVPWAGTKYQVKALLDNYGRARGGGQVFHPIVALRRAGLWELDADLEQVPSVHGSSGRRWFDDHQPNGGLVQPVYDLLRESPEALHAAVNVLIQNYFTEAGNNATMLLSELGLSEPEVPSPFEAASFTARATEYQRLCGRADVFWHDRDTKRAARTSSIPIRSKDARDAVRLRSEGRCENPSCTGDIDDLTDEGQAILEVDHIKDLALGGDDDPEQMIALCPNCHATKTRGSKRANLKPILLAAAKDRHERLSNAAPG